MCVCTEKIYHTRTSGQHTPIKVSNCNNEDLGSKPWAPKLCVLYRPYFMHSRIIIPHMQQLDPWKELKCLPALASKFSSKLHKVFLWAACFTSYLQSFRSWNERKKLEKQHVSTKVRPVNQNYCIHREHFQAIGIKQPLLPNTNIKIYHHFRHVNRQA